MADGVPDIGSILVRTTEDKAGQPITIVMGTGAKPADALEAMRASAREQIETLLTDAERSDVVLFEIVGVRVTAGMANAETVGSGFPPRWCVYGTLTGQMRNWEDPDE